MGDAEKKGVLRFVDVGLWGGDTSGAHDFSFLPNLNMSKMLSMPSIRARLSHATRELDVLKIDIEGSEHSLFRDAENASALFGVGVGQLLIEVHGRDFMGVKRLVSQVY